MRYLLYLSFYEPFHAHLDKLLYNIFCKSETRSLVCVHQCKGSLPYCPAIDTPLPKLTPNNSIRIGKLILIQSFLRPVFCTKCINATNKFFAFGQKFKFAPLGLFLYLKSVVLFFSRQKFRAKLHESCLDNTLSCYLVSTRMELNDVRLSFKLSRFLVTRDFHIRESRELLNTHSPDFIGMFNGRMLPYRSMLNVATKSINQPTVIVHERGFEDSSFVIKINEPAHSRSFLSKVFSFEYKKILDTVPDQLAMDWAQHFFEGRKIGSNIDCIAPIYSSPVLEGHSIYLTSRKLVVLYLTTPDEVDPCSDEFLLIKHQWQLIPAVCKLLNNSFGASNIRIVIRTHPNFFLRYGAPLYNLDQKINTLRKRLSLFDNVFIDVSPKDTSPFIIYKNSFLSVSFASSSLLESEYFGTPSLVDASHIYSHGVSYSYDFNSLLNAGLAEVTSLPSSFIREMNSGACINPRKVISFAFIWYYINTFRFDTVKYSQFNKIVVSDLNYENSPDYNFIKAGHHLDSVNFIRSRIYSFGIS